MLKGLRHLLIKWLFKDGLYLPGEIIGKNTIRIDGEKVQLATLTTDPTAPAEGWLWYNATDDALRLFTTATRDVWPAAPAGLVLIRKTADEIVNNSAILQSDDHLYFSVGANEAWAFDMLLRVKSSTTADFQYSFAVPTGGDVYTTPVLYFDFDAAQTEAGLAVWAPVIVPGAGALRRTHHRFLYIGGANAGTVQLQWAQAVAEVSDTIVYANSYIIAHKIG